MSNPNYPNYQQSVDQSDRFVPYNLRQTGDPGDGVRLLISTRIRKSPYWHLSVAAGCWRAEVYNRTYHPRGFVRPSDGGTMAEYDAVVNDVTLWNVAVERQIRILGPDAEAFCNYVCTRDVTRIPAMHARYVILCDSEGHLLSDPILLRLSKDEFWFSLSDSDLAYWFKGINAGGRFDISINEIDVSPLQIQGPKSEALMTDLFGGAIHEMPYYGLLNATLDGADVVVSQTGYTGEKGYEVYARNSMVTGETVWNAIVAAGAKHNLKIIAPAHHRRIAAGILSYGQDADQETFPFQCNLGHMVPRNKGADYVGKQALEKMRKQVDAGHPPFHHQLVGLRLGGKPIEDYAPDFWLIAKSATAAPCGYVTSPWYSPELKTNIAMGYVPVADAVLGTKFVVWLPRNLLVTPGEPVDAEVVAMPFRKSVNPSAREQAKEKGRDFAF